MVFESGFLQAGDDRQVANSRNVDSVAVLGVRFATLAQYDLFGRSEVGHQAKMFIRFILSLQAPNFGLDLELINSAEISMEDGKSITYCSAVRFSRYCLCRTRAEALASASATSSIFLFWREKTPRVGGIDVFE